MEVKATINGSEYTLTYNSTTELYEAVITAPTTTSYNVNDDHYYPITITATDDYGNTTTVDDSDASEDIETKLFVKETTAPVISEITPSDGAFSSNNTPSFYAVITDEENGSGIDPSSVKFYVNGDEYSGSKLSGNTYYKSGLVLEDGVINWSVEASDYDGNIVSRSASYTLDTIAPILNITSPPSTSTTVNTDSYTFEGTTADTNSVAISIDFYEKNDWGTYPTDPTDSIDSITVGSDGSFSYTHELSEGVTKVIITATDAAGQTTTSLEYYIDVNTAGANISTVSISADVINVGQIYTLSVAIADVSSDS